MRTTRTLIGACLLIAFVSATSITVSAATVRGRISCAAGGRGPVTGKAVTVFNAGIGRSKQVDVGADGMFYLYNIPANNYVLEVRWKTNSSLPPQTFQLKVLEPYTNVPAFTVPC